MHAIALAVAGIPYLPDLGGLVGEHARDLVRADRVAIFEWSAAPAEFRAIAATPGNLDIPTIASGSGAVGAAFAQRRPIAFDDYPSAAEALDWAVRLGVHAVAAVPLISAREPLGVLVACRFSPRAYTAEQLNILLMLGTLGVAPMLGAAALRTRMRQQSPQMARVLEGARPTDPVNMSLDGAVGQVVDLSRARTADKNPRLTRREREILPLLAQGHTNREIGALLHLSPGTVRNLVARIQGKMGARDRTHAVVLALARGLF